MVHVTARTVHHTRAKRDSLIVHDDARVTVKIRLQPTHTRVRLTAGEEADPVDVARLHTVASNVIATTALEALH